MVTCRCSMILRAGLSRNPVLKDRVVSFPLGSDLLPSLTRFHTPLWSVPAPSPTALARSKLWSVYTADGHMPHGVSEMASLFGTQVLMMV